MGRVNAPRKIARLRALLFRPAAGLNPDHDRPRESGPGRGNLLPLGEWSPRGYKPELSLHLGEHAAFQTGGGRQINTLGVSGLIT